MIVNNIFLVELKYTKFKKLFSTPHFFKWGFVKISLTQLIGI